MTEWQPIETAPKDGRKIDVFCGNAEFPQRYCDITFREPTDGEFWCNGVDDDVDIKNGEIDRYRGWFCPLIGKLQGDNFPTHWMPVPDPPKNG